MIQTTLSLLLLTSVASPQTTPDLPSLESTQALTEWRTDHGARWKTMSTRGTGHPDFLFGGLAQPFNAPVSDAAFTAAALDFLARTEGIHGMESETLSLDRALLLPLGQVGSTDKMTVRFHQSVNGVPVKEGAVNVLMNLEGQLLSVQSSGLPLVADFDTTPSISAAGAMRVTEETFKLEYSLTPTSLSRPELSLVQLEVGELVKPALAYEVQAMWQSQGFEPEGQIYWVDAKSGAVINRMPAIHNLDVTGTVYTMATPGTTPDTASNPEIQEPLAYAQVQSSSGTTSTDVNGNFTISGTNGPLNVTIAYVGTFANCNNDTGSDYSLTTSLSGTGNSV
ncbi:MAG: hypothetical protein OSB14_02505, partial [Planctomycetota bacterium]|nr:hypothetical protein [Planctomycetota bacterium]